MAMAGVGARAGVDGAALVSRLELAATAAEAVLYGIFAC
jgi:hypothetical protein